MLAEVTCPKRLIILMTPQTHFTRRLYIESGRHGECSAEFDLPCQPLRFPPFFAFNTVNQRDSNSLKEESQAMKIIANMTMLSLATTTFAVSFREASQLLNGS